MNQNANLKLVLLVLSTVLIQLLVAVILKELTGHDSTWLWTAMVIGFAVGLNGLRFLIWAYTHRRYPLSLSYPLTALFFPCILGVSAIYGESISPQQVVAVAVIMTGIVLMNWPAREGATSGTRSSMGSGQ